MAGSPGAPRDVAQAHGAGENGEHGKGGVSNEAGTAEGGGAQSGAPREAISRLFQGRGKPDTQREQAGKIFPNRMTTLEPGPAEKMSAAEKRLQDSIRRIEAERNRRATAAGVWQNDGPRKSTWKDW